MRIVHGISGMYNPGHLDNGNRVFLWYTFDRLDRLCVEQLAHSRMCSLDKLVFDYSGNELAHNVHQPKFGTLDRT